jgi:predicted transposase/invertase (TIGR01784 family)
MNPDAFEPVRLEFYTGKLFTGQNIRGSGKTYDDLQEVYQIAFLASRKFFEDELFLHEFEYYDHKRGVSLGGRSRIITIELSKLKGLAEKPVEKMTPAERWAFYFRYIRDRRKRSKVNEILGHEEGIAMASEVLIGISRDEAERARLLSEYKYVVDLQSKIVQAQRESKLEDARNALKEGLSVEQVARITGVPVDELQKHYSEWV